MVSYYLPDYSTLHTICLVGLGVFYGSEFMLFYGSDLGWFYVNFLTCKKLNIRLFLKYSPAFYFEASIVFSSEIFF